MEPIKLILVGVGSRGSSQAAHCAERNEVTIVAVCDVNLARARLCVETSCAPGTPVFKTVEEALETVDCDAVWVATGDAHHTETVVPSLQAGKKVFCEKPLETTIEKCEAIIAADKEAGGKTFVGFNLRYAPVYSKVRELIDAGEIGRILTIQADEFYDGGRTYFRRWNRLRAESGGLWVTKASHDFDLIQWFAGTEPLAVQAFAERSYYIPKEGAAAQCRDCNLAATCPDRAPLEPPIHVRLAEEHDGEPSDRCLFTADSDTFDHGIATVRFANDIFATYTCNVVAGFSNRSLRISGTKGTIDGSLLNDTITLTRRDPAEVVTISVTEKSLGGGDMAGGHGGSDEILYHDFFAFVRGSIEPKCRPTEGLVAVRIGLAATQSADEGRLISLS